MAEMYDIRHEVHGQNTSGPPKPFCLKIIWDVLPLNGGWLIYHRIHENIMEYLGLHCNTHRLSSKKFISEELRLWEGLIPFMICERLGGANVLLCLAC